MKDFYVVDSGAFRSDPYILLNEKQEPVAQSYSNDGKHYKHGLDEVVEHIAALRALLKEAGEALEPFAKKYEGVSEYQRETWVYKDEARAAELRKRIEEALA